MRLFAIADLHFSYSVDKPMDIFGSRWDNHSEQICSAWNQTVAPEDAVLVPGDISWGMYLEEAASDLEALGRLPGKKFILRGNHDYWWSSLTKVISAVDPSIIPVQNNSAILNNTRICGTRGWNCPSKQTGPEDHKIYERELVRLELSLKSAKDTPEKIAMLHFPPFDEYKNPTGFTRLLEQYGVSRAVYGHLHGKSCAGAFEGVYNGIEYTLVSSDHLGFTPKLITEL